MPTEDEIADWRTSGRGPTLDRELELLRKIEALTIERAHLRTALEVETRRAENYRKALGDLAKATTRPTTVA